MHTDIHTYNAFTHTYIHTYILEHSTHTLAHMYVPMYIGILVEMIQGSSHLFHRNRIQNLPYIISCMIGAEG